MTETTASSVKRPLLNDFDHLQRERPSVRADPRQSNSNGCAAMDDGGSESPRARREEAARGA
jgi:hypothetical protein